MCSLFLQWDGRPQVSHEILWFEQTSFTKSKFTAIALPAPHPRLAALEQLINASLSCHSDTRPVNNTRLSAHNSSFTLVEAYCLYGFDMFMPFFSLAVVNSVRRTADSALTRGFYSPNSLWCDGLRLLQGRPATPLLQWFHGRICWN